MAVSARPAPPQPKISVRKQVAFSLIMLVLVLGAIEASVRAYHAVRNVGSGDPEPRGYVVDDAQAGYSLKPGYTGGLLRASSASSRRRRSARGASRRSLPLAANRSKATNEAGV